MADPRLAPFRLPSLVFAGFLVVVMVSGAFIFLGRMGPGEEAVVRYYRGDEATFAPPKSVDGLLLSVVPHLVAIPLALFAVAHLVGWAGAIGPGAWRVLVGLSFGGAAVTIAGGFAVRFVVPEAAWLKTAGFLGLELALLAWTVLLVRLFLPPRGRGS
jgi:hypothetical protein